MSEFMLGPLCSYLPAPLRALGSQRSRIPEGKHPQRDICHRSSLRGGEQPAVGIDPVCAAYTACRFVNSAFKTNEPERGQASIAIERHPC